MRIIVSDPDDQGAAGGVGLETNELSSVEQESRNRRDTQFSGALPVGIDLGGKTARSDNRQRQFRVKSDRSGNGRQNIDLGNIFTISKVGTVDRLAKSLPGPQLLGPLRQFLRPAAVVGAGPVTEGESQFPRHLAQAGKNRPDIHPTGKEVMQVQSVGRCFRMQREHRPAHIQTKLPSQFFDAHGTEIAPGSDKIEKNLECSHSPIVTFFSFFPGAAARLSRPPGNFFAISATY